MSNTTIATQRSRRETDYFHTFIDMMDALCFLLFYGSECEIRLPLARNECKGRRSLFLSSSCMVWRDKDVGRLPKIPSEGCAYRANLKASLNEKRCDCECPIAHKNKERSRLSGSTRRKRTLFDAALSVNPKILRPNDLVDANWIRPSLALSLSIYLSLFNHEDSFLSYCCFNFPFWQYLGTNPGHGCLGGLESARLALLCGGGHVCRLFARCHVSH